MTHRRTLFCLSLLLASACATPVQIDSPGHALAVELNALQVTQQVFREQNTTPIDFEFPGHGRVTVREVSLDGWPGGAYVRCRFHYQNRTEKPVVQAWVSLDVLDPEGRVVSSQSCNCVVPVPIAIARGSYYSDELRTPTYGAHLQPGWTWRIRCTARLEAEEEPLHPPAPERLLRQSAPMQIRAR